LRYVFNPPAGHKAVPLVEANRNIITFCNQSDNIGDAIFWRVFQGVDKEELSVAISSVVGMDVQRVFSGVAIGWFGIERREAGVRDDIAVALHHPARVWILGMFFNPQKLIFSGSWKEIARSGAGLNIVVINAAERIHIGIGHTTNRAFRISSQHCY